MIASPSDNTRLPLSSARTIDPPDDFTNAVAVLRSRAAWTPRSAAAGAGLIALVSINSESCLRSYSYDTSFGRSVLEEGDVGLTSSPELVLFGACMTGAVLPSGTIPSPEALG